MGPCGKRLRAKALLSGDVMKSELTENKVDAAVFLALIGLLITIVMVWRFSTG